MKSKIVSLLLFSLLCQRVKSLSPEEDLEIEEELKRLNKPANQDNSDGVWRHYDCVDFYKQPAFDHPLLKNHSFHFGRSWDQERLSARGINSATIKRLDCPTGTVPIRRTSKELIAAKMQAKVHAQHSGPNTVDVHGLHLAIVRTEFGPLKKYNGGGMFSSVEVPKASGTQYSAGQMKIENIPDFIQAGWMIFSDDLRRCCNLPAPLLRLMGNSSCFNVQCPGFILMRSDHPVDAIFKAHSHRGGPVYTYNYFIYLDPTSGLWWLQLGEDSIVVGFRPKKIFSGPGFQDLATYLEWGGQTYSPPEVKSPPMGRGDFLTGDVKLTASCQDITTITEAHEGVPPADTQAYSDREKYHWALDRGYLKGPLKHVMLFGGPGGATGWA